MMKFILFFTPFALLLSNFAQAKFANESEVAALVTGGNTQVETYNFKTLNTYKINSHLLTGSAIYTYGEADELRSAENWEAKLRYDYFVNDILSYFASQQVESNRFAGFKRRYNSDIGVKYIFNKTEKNTTKAELGYRFTSEEFYPESLGDIDLNKIRVYAETLQKLSPTAEAKLWVEYLPNLTVSEDYLIRTEASLAAAIDARFSVKLAYQWIMDNQPVAGNSKYDYLYTASLLAKF